MAEGINGLCGVIVCVCSQSRSACCARAAAFCCPPPRAGVGCGQSTGREVRGWGSSQTLGLLGKNGEDGVTITNQK